MNEVSSRNRLLEISAELQSCFISAAFAREILELTNQSEVTFSQFTSLVLSLVIGSAVGCYSAFHLNTMDWSTK
jgi:hypothetical protein